MNIGIYGGTFDPVHYGHLILAEQCREQCQLDQVWFLPAGSPPHKDVGGITAGRNRLEMLDFALAGCDNLLVNGMELDRDGPSYTVDTLDSLHRQHPEHAMFLIIGADSLDDLHHWREPERIASLATLVAVNRGDCPLPDHDQLVQTLGTAIASRIRYVTMPGVDVSSTDIRDRVRSGRSIRFLTPRAVDVYVTEHKLYTA